MAETGSPTQWSTWPQAVWLCARGRTWRAALPVALVVGTLLTVINQGDVLLAGWPGLVTWARVAANYAIPYVVSSIGFLTACRAPR